MDWLQILVLVATITVGVVPNVLWKMVSFDHHKRGWNRPQVSLKVSSGVTSTVVSCYKHMIGAWYATFGTNVNLGLVCICLHFILVISLDFSYFLQFFPCSSPPVPCCLIVTAACISTVLSLLVSHTHATYKLGAISLSRVHVQLFSRNTNWREAMRQSACVAASCVWARGLPVVSSAAWICPNVGFGGVWLWAGAWSRWAISCLCLCPKEWAIPLRNSPLSKRIGPRWPPSCNQPLPQQNP